jgi:hypothetical protein
MRGPRKHVHPVFASQPLSLITILHLGISNWNWQQRGHSYRVFNRPKRDGKTGVTPHGRKLLAMRLWSLLLVLIALLGRQGMMRGVGGDELQLIVWAQIDAG